MNEKDLLEGLELPKTTWIKRTMPLNRFLTRVTSKQGETLQSTIQAYGFRILAVLNSNNTNIPKFMSEEDYFEEIHFYSIELKEWNKQKELFRIIAGEIPYPIVIYFHHEDQWQIVAGKYHRHQNQIELVLDKVYTSNKGLKWVDYQKRIKFSSLNLQNLKTLYESIIQSMIQVEAEEKYDLKLDTKIDDSKLEEIKAIDQKIERLRKKARSETQMNHRVRLNMEIKKLKEEKEQRLEEMN